MPDDLRAARAGPGTTGKARKVPRGLRTWPSRRADTLPGNGQKYDRSGSSTVQIFSTSFKRRSAAARPGSLRSPVRASGRTLNNSRAHGSTVFSVTPVFFPMAVTHFSSVSVRRSSPATSAAVCSARNT